MSIDEKYRDQIQRSTQRLAHLTARQLVRKQREAERIRDTQRRMETQWKMALGAALIDSGVAKLPPEEIFGVLLAYRATPLDPAKREIYRKRGTDWLTTQSRELKALNYE